MTYTSRELRDGTTFQVNMDQVCYCFSDDDTYETIHFSNGNGFSVKKVSGNG